MNTGKFIFQHTAVTLFISIFVGMLKFVEDWFALESKKKEIENFLNQPLNNNNTSTNNI
jgi:ABC-type bacteriocin/lantibiotic exporter with double-glycine peptidase domain